MIKIYVATLSVILISGCAKFGAAQNPIDPAFFTEGDTSLNPSTDKLAADCFAGAEFDACLYQKNPVAQEKGVVDPGEADSKRRFGVKIRGLAGSGLLENSRVQVYSLGAARFDLSQRAQLKNQMDREFTVQFSAYYWSNRMFDYLGARLGANALPLRNLKIYPDDVFTGYSASNKSIHFAKKDGEIARAYSGEIVIQLTAQALADAITDGKLFLKDSTQHNYCVLDPKGCCKTEMGCAQALGSAFGDYVSAVMFPESARLGETVGGTPEGQKICSISRDLNSLASKSRSQVFGACDPKGRAPLMGAWYAAIWWKLRMQAEAAETGASRDIDILFFEHFKTLGSTSTFAEAKRSAKSAAQNYKNGLYFASVTAAFANAAL